MRESYQQKDIQWNPFEEATLMRGNPFWKGHLTP